MSLLQLIIALLIAVQNPNVPADLRAQAILVANQALQLSMQSENTSSNPPANNSSEPAQQPTNPGQTTPPADPLFGSSTFTPESPIGVEILQSVPKSGGTLSFKVTKNGKPAETIDLLTSPLTNQVFKKLPEDLPPGQGIFHIYIPAQTEDVTPSLSLTISGTTVEVPITFAQ